MFPSAHETPDEDLAQILNLLNKLEPLTLAQYVRLLREVAKDLIDTVPGVSVSVDKAELWMRTEHCSGILELRSHTMRAGAMTPAWSVCSGTALTGKVADVKRGLENYERILEALRQCELHVGAATITP